MTEIVSDDGLMRACNSCKKGGVFYGGSARMVQDALGISGDHFLYVGDHIYTDAALAKLNFKCEAPPHLCPCIPNSCHVEVGSFLRPGTPAFALAASTQGIASQVADCAHHTGAGGRDRGSGEGLAIPQEAESVAEEKGNHRCCALGTACFLSSVHGLCYRHCRTLPYNCQ